MRAAACARAIHRIKRQFFCITVAVNGEVCSGLGIKVLIDVEFCVCRRSLREGGAAVATATKHKPFAPGFDLKNVDKEKGASDRTCIPPHHI